MESRFSYMVDKYPSKFHSVPKNKTSDELLPSRSDVIKSQQKNNYRFV